jgi:predicted MFS family arabinose efflux permease
MKPAPYVFSSYEKFVIALLAFLQFTVILDFMIMAPLGAAIMPVLKITPAQFGVAVSVYAFSAGAAGLIAAGFSDNFDRKKLLLFFYTGFILGTLFCGLAPTYEFLLGARLFTGVFGGVIGATAFAITIDLFPVEVRGRVMGIMQTAFAASQILGLPIGLYLSNHFGWHSPFLAIVIVGVFAGIAIAVKMKPVRDHLLLKKESNPFLHLFATLKNRRYLLAFSATGLLSIGGYMLMPFGSAFTVNNLKIPIEELPLIYLVTGVASILFGPLVGKLSDRFGAFRVFVFGTAVSIVMVVIYTNLGPSSLAVVLIVNVVMFVGIFSRMIPSQTIMSVIPSPESRGSFMSVGSSIQQIAGGLAAVVAGRIVSADKSGALHNMKELGYVMVGIALFALTLMYFVHRMVSRMTPAKNVSA